MHQVLKRVKLELEDDLRDEIAANREKMQSTRKFKTTFVKY